MFLTTVYIDKSVDSHEIILTIDGWDCQKNINKYANSQIKIINSTWKHEINRS